MTPDLVIFDCDGVLVDTESVSNTAISRNLARYGLHIPPSECITLFVGGTMQSVMQEALRMGAPLPGDWLDEIYAEMFAALAQGVAVIDGVFDILDQLDQQGIATCVASNGPDAKMDVTLTPSGLHDRFAGRIFSAHSHGKPKPEPDLLLVAAEHLGAAPERCVMIDDSPSGVISAVAAGMRAIGYDERDDPGRLSRHGAEVITSMRALPELLGL